MQNTNYGTIDFKNETITLTKAFVKKATKVGSVECEQMWELLEKYKGFKFKEKTIKRNPEKTTYANLKYKNMALYIKTTEGEKSATLEELEMIKKASIIQTSPYMYVRNWFLTKYPNYKEFQSVIEKIEARAKQESANKVAPTKKSA